jgi:hypothetical protein
MQWNRSVLAGTLLSATLCLSIQSNSISSPPISNHDAQNASKDVWKVIDRHGAMVDAPISELPKWNQWTVSTDDWGREMRSREDAQGRLLEFESDIGPIDDNLFKVKRGNLYGFADVSGKIVIDPCYEDVQYFHNGFNEVRDTRLSPWKVIDKRGATKCLLPDNLEPNVQISFWGVSKEGILPVKKKLAPRSLEREEDGIFDINTLNYSPVGNYIVISEFKEDLAKFDSVSPMKFGYINKFGKIVIPKAFDHAADFSEGLAPVLLNNRWSYIDHAGKQVIQLAADCSHAGSFHEGLAAVALGGESKIPQYLAVRKGAHWGFIDHNGKLLIPAKFYVNQMSGRGLASNCPNFAEGLAHVAVGDELNHQYGFIDRKGAWVIKPQFKNASEFKDGHARVCLGETGFTQEDWKKERNGYRFRTDVFRLFIKQYGLIGMRRQQVLELLGEPAGANPSPAALFQRALSGTLLNDYDTYTLCATGCGNAYRAVEIRYNNDKVVEYRYVGFESQGPWISNISSDKSL